MSHSRLVLAVFAVVVAAGVWFSACGSTQCSGCTSAGSCVAGTANDACGKDGAACVACGTGKTCSSGACVANGGGGGGGGTGGGAAGGGSAGGGSAGGGAAGGGSGGGASGGGAGGGGASGGGAGGGGASGGGVGGGSGGGAGGGSGGGGGDADGGTLCTSTGGTVSSSMCCQSAGDFPDSCAVGACSCAPQYSHTVLSCDCPPTKCYDITVGCH